jgi:hypothetical protein
VRVPFGWAKAGNPNPVASRPSARRQLLFFAAMRDLRAAIGISAAVALCAGTAVFFMPHPIRLGGVDVGDIGLPLAGMIRFLHHTSPYDLRLRAGSAALYPFPTMLGLSWLLLIPLRYVAAVFCGVSSFLLSFAILREDEWWRMLLFASPAFWSAMSAVQWSPLITAALLMPALLPVSVAKPQLGVVLAAAGRWSRPTILVTVLILAVSVALFPRWPIEWLAKGQLASFDGRVPLLVIPGFLLVASAICWRTARGRRMIAMSVVIQRYFYDQLPLFLQPATLRQMLILLVSSWAAVGVSAAQGWWRIGHGRQDSRTWTAVVIGTYLPALVMTIWNDRRDARQAEMTKADETQPPSADADQADPRPPTPGPHSSIIRTKSPNR